MLSSTPLRDRPVAQYRMGEGEANLRAARAFLFEAMARRELRRDPSVQALPKSIITSRSGPRVRTRFFGLMSP